MVTFLLFCFNLFSGVWVIICLFVKENVLTCRITYLFIYESWVQSPCLASIAAELVSSWGPLPPDCTPFLECSVNVSPLCGVADCFPAVCK